MNQTSRARPLPVALVALLVAFGALTQATRLDAQSGLGGTSWQLVKFQGGDGTTLTPDDKAKYTLQFGADGQLSVRLDCNRGRGTWKSAGPNQMQLGPLALTRAMCPPGSLHDRILKHWDFIRSSVIKDGHLFLSLMADGGIYEFEPVAASSATTPGAASSSNTLEGPVWRLTKLRGQSDQTIAALKAAPTLQFEAGRVEGFAGCNRLAGSYTIDGERLTFGSLLGTLMACPEPAMSIETAFKKALGGTMRSRVGADGLSLFAASDKEPTLVFVADRRP